MLLAPRSSAVALTPVRTSTSWFFHHSAGCMYTSSSGFSPRRYSFVSGGRWYGTCASRAITSVDPSPPCSRYSWATIPPASPPPTITF